MEELSEKLIEPLKYYYEELKDTFEETVKNFFDELVEKSHIDVDLNKKLSHEYEELRSEKERINKKLNLMSILSKIILVSSIICAIIVAFLLYRFWHTFPKDIIIKILIFFSISISLFFLRSKYILIKISEASLLFEELQEKCKKKLDECYASMSALNSLMDSKYTFELINRNIPFIKLDPYFNMKRFEELYYVYGLGANTDKNYSTLEAVSGNILGNPFVLLKELEHAMKLHTYTGSLSISWTESYIDSDGKRQTRTRYETLYASIERPKPEYSEFISLILANDVASNLTFSRQPGHIEQLSESSLKRKIRKEEKNLNKLEEKSIKTGKSFVALANTEFEVLFNALNRTNETEFRLLFTPLAQQNMVRLLKNKEYGDNFYFLKNKKINTVIAEHTKNWDLDCNVNKFRTYSYEQCRNFFINFNTKYFNNFFFSMAPLISIPLYQQFMASDYIYDTEFKNNYNPYTCETLANAMNKNYFVHPDTKSSTILKANAISAQGETDLVKINAYSYDIIPRIEYVRKRGGDGYYHDVPVHWDEYIPLENESLIELKQLGIDDTVFEGIASSEEDSSIFRNKDSYTYKSKILGKVFDNETSETENLFNDIIKKLKVNI